jgi:hypothetical protein
MNSVTSDTSLGGFLGQGIGPLLQSRVLGLVSAIQIFFVIAVPVVLAPFILIGAWARRRSMEFGPFFVYAALLFAAAGLLFAVHVPYGTFLHSAVALVPFTFILAFEGALLASKWMVRHRPGWTEEGAARLFLIAAVASVVFTAGAFTALALPGWNTERDNLIAAGKAIDEAGAPRTDLVLSADPGGIEYFTGHGGVVTPNDSLEVIHQVAIDYHIRWLVLERAHIVDPMVPVIEGKTQPDWIGGAVLVVPYTGPKSGDAAADAAPAMVVLAVCTQAGDTRCSKASGPGATP